MNTINVCHITSAHLIDDVRIFHKECKSLANTGFDVSIVTTGVSDSKIDGITIVNAGSRSKGRMSRMFWDVWKVYLAAKKTKSKLYHFHDPELLFVGYLLQLGGAKVIYDIHEDLPRQVLSKPYLNNFSSKLISWGIELFENALAARFSAVITATPFINQRFSKISKNAVNINNFPLKSEIPELGENNFESNSICYIGGISRVRGMEELIKSLSHCNDITLELAGNLPNDDLSKELTGLDGWRFVNELGYISREKAKEVKSRCIAGIVTFLPVPNHINSQPNKIYEYMAAGIPVIGSNFPLWKNIIEENKCGICVAPDSPDEIAKAITYIQNNRTEAMEMGKRGRELICTTYNWSIEEKKLTELYHILLD